MSFVFVYFPLIFSSIFRRANDRCLHDQLLHTFHFQMSLFGKKGRDPSQLPTLSYDIPLIIPKNVDNQPQEISFLDLITNDDKFVIEISYSL